MSSRYEAICLNHSPALAVESGWTSPAAALAAVETRTGDLAEHADCDLLIGRYSYPLIEVCCPPHQPHAEPRWIDAAWLRLTLAAYTIQRDAPAVNDAIERLANVARCWQPERIQGLRRLLDMEEAAR